MNNKKLQKYEIRQKEPVFFFCKCVSAAFYGTWKNSFLLTDKARMSFIDSLIANIILLLSLCVYLLLYGSVIAMF